MARRRLTPDEITPGGRFRRYQDTLRLPYSHDIIVDHRTASDTYEHDELSFVTRALYKMYYAPFLSRPWEIDTQQAESFLFYRRELHIRDAIRWCERKEYEYQVDHFDAYYNEAEFNYGFTFHFQREIHAALFKMFEGNWAADLCGEDVDREDDE